MPTQTKPNATPVIESVEQVAERVTELSEKAVANGKKAGGAYIDSSEKALLSLADAYEKAAEATKVDWVADIATVQADFTREIAKAYVSAARDAVA